MAAMVSCRFFNQSVDSLGAAQATAQAVFQQLGRIDLKISKGFLETWAWLFITAANVMCSCIFFTLARSGNLRVMNHWTKRLGKPLDSWTMET